MPSVSSPPPAGFERARASLETSKEIRAWLVRERIGADERNQIVQQAHELLNIEVQNGTSHRHRSPSGRTAEEISAQCQSPHPKPTRPEALSQYGRSLARWLAYHVSDPQIRNCALDLAKQESDDR